MNIIKVIASINWQPHIGDPGIIGWVITILYIFFSGMCVLSGLKERSNLQRLSFPELFWYFLALTLLFLGLNKQIDLQSLFIEMGRQVARQYGFYEQRREIQRFFVILFFFFSVAPMLFMLKILLHDIRKYYLVFMGMLIIVLFVLIRASSMSHIYIVPDVYRAVGAVKMKYAMEFCGLCVIGAGVLNFLRMKE